MSNLETVQKMYDAFRNRDRDRLLQIFDPEIEWIQNDGFPGESRHVGAASVVDEVFGALRSDWDHWRAPVSEWIDAGDTVIALGQYQGVYAATGNGMTAAFAHVYDLRKGRIVRYRQYTDTLKIAEAMR